MSGAAAAASVLSASGAGWGLTLARETLRQMTSRLQDTVTTAIDMSEAWSLTSKEEGGPGKGITMGDKALTAVDDDDATRGTLNIKSSFGSPALPLKAAWTCAPCSAGATTRRFPIETQAISLKESEFFGT